MREDCQYLESGSHLSTDINISWYFGFVLYHRLINFSSCVFFFLIKVIESQ